MTDSIAARLAALPQTSTPDLKAMWHELNGKPAPAFNRSYLISRLAYRIQELAYGGLKPATRAKLDALADGLDPKQARKRAPARLIAGTRLCRGWQGVEHIGHRAPRRRLRLAGPALRQPVGGRARDHRHALERAVVLRPAERQGMSAAPIRKLRCAVYTRKSSEEGLEQEFNSLDAQREAGVAYIQSQRAEGWVALPDRYDDGGVSGGTLERPALQRLLRDVEAGLIDVIVVYKIDRLSRSLMDFAKLMEAFEQHEVTFVSVTQQFNTTTSMGRLTLNILLSLRPVRARGDRRADPGQVRRHPPQGHVDGRQRPARLPGRGQEAGRGRDRGRAGAAGSSPASPPSARRSRSPAS